jgi:hypothetical protein
MVKRNQEPDVDTLWTLGFAGPGDIMAENAGALLDKELPQNFEAVYVPSKIGRSECGLRVVVKWLSEVLGADGVQKVDDVLDSLAKADEPVLVWVRGEEDTPDDILFLGDALDQGIRVLDLGQNGGMDDITEDDLSRLDDQPELPADEPEPPAAPRTRRGGGKVTTTRGKPAESTTAPRRGRARTHPASRSIDTSGEDELHPTRRTASSRTRTTTAVTADKVQELMDPVIKDMLSAGDADPEMSIGHALYGLELKRYIDARISRAFNEQVFTILPKIPRGHPKADGSPATPYMEEELTFVERADGELKLRGPGKPRAGTQTVTMTRREAIEQGLIEED